jgi:hypothetical protein
MEQGMLAKLVDVLEEKFTVLYSARESLNQVEGRRLDYDRK